MLADGTKLSPTGFRSMSCNTTMPVVSLDDLVTFPDWWLSLNSLIFSHHHRLWFLGKEFKVGFVVDTFGMAFNPICLALFQGVPCFFMSFVSVCHK